MTPRRPKPSYDVVFYQPTVTPLLGGGADPVAGGAETQIVLLAAALARRGLRVCVVADPAAGLPTAFRGFDVVARARSLATRPVVGKALEAARIHAALRSVSAPVVVTRVAGVQVGLVGAAAKALGRRFVYSSANIFDFDFDALGFRRRDLALYRLGVRLADEIVVQTEEQARACWARFGRPSALARSIAEPATRSGDPEALLWVGRLVSYKQPLAFIDLARSVPEASFRLVGVPGPESGSLVEDVRRAATGVPNLELLEPRPRAGVLDLIGRSAAVVNTSTYEGMPNIFLEGWARGVPALALAHDPDGVIKRHGLGAFAGGSREALVTAARRLWEERDHPATGEACRRYVAEHHAEANVVSQWELVLKPRRAEPRETAVPGVAGGRAG
jgi:glycosyltransferase involved in cell wall biosynthesis